MTNTDSGIPYIKHEADDNMGHQSYPMGGQGYGGNQNTFGNQMNQSIDPLDLEGGNYGMQYSFGSQQNLNSGFKMGKSVISDDELLDLLSDPSAQTNDFGRQGQNNDPFGDQRHPSGISMSHQGQMTNVYSSTPEGPPIQSPFLNSFDYSHFRSSNGMASHMSQSNPHFAPQFGKRASVQSIERRTSEHRSPLTPRTPAIGGLHINTPESGGFASHPIRTTNSQERSRKTQSGQWDVTPSSLHSFIDSPISSPGHPSHHSNINEIIRSGKNASLPTKVENGQVSESIESKKKRRRASHNAVERRRRDNINDRIQDLSHLVPQHRLEDDKVRKQLVNHTPMSPSLGATGISPPNAATSLLAGAAGRRAASTAGNITLGLPIEEKEKGPNKGDILNGSVSWTRDLMWALYNKYMQEDALQELWRQNNNEDWPFEISENDKRMRSELVDAMEKNDVSSFEYTRSNGTGLRVPRHTNIAGEPLPAGLSPQSMSPPFQSGGSGTNSGSQQPQYWENRSHGMSFKEEDEYAMDMN